MEINLQTEDPKTLTPKQSEPNQSIKQSSQPHFRTTTKKSLDSMVKNVCCPSTKSNHQNETRTHQHKLKIPNQTKVDSKNVTIRKRNKPLPPLTTKKLFESKIPQVSNKINSNSDTDIKNVLEVTVQQLDKQVNRRLFQNDSAEKESVKKGSSQLQASGIITVISVD